MLLRNHGMIKESQIRTAGSWGQPSTDGDAVCPRKNRRPETRGFILAETLVLSGTAGDNGIAGGTFYQPVL